MPRKSFRQLNAKNFSLYVLLMLPFLAQANSEPEKTLTLSTLSYKPWVYIEKGEFKGITVDILERAATNIDVKLKVNVAPPKRVIADLNAGNADISLLITSKSLRASDYSTDIEAGTPLFKLRISAMSLKSSNAIVQSTEDLVSYKLGAIRLPNNVLSDFFPEHSKIYMYANSDAIIKGLLTKRIDIGVTALANLASSARSLNVDHKLDVVYLFPQKSQVIVGWSRKRLASRGRHLSIRLDEALIEMKRNGEFEKIIEQYSDVSFFDDYR